jgi:hypothetical protein
MTGHRDTREQSVDDTLVHEIKHGLVRVDRDRVGGKAVGWYGGRTLPRVM